MGLVELARINKNAEFKEYLHEVSDAGLDSQECMV